MLAWLEVWENCWLGWGFLPSILKPRFGTMALGYFFSILAGDVLWEFMNSAILLVSFLVSRISVSRFDYVKPESEAAIFCSEDKWYLSIWLLYLWRVLGLISPRAAWIAISSFFIVPRKLRSASFGAWVRYRSHLSSGSYTIWCLNVCSALTYAL